MAAHWTESDVPDQSGRVALITGSNTGIGFEAARVLAERGARVILACRDEQRAADAVQRIKAARPDADVDVVPLDVSDMASVANAAKQIKDAEPRLDLLINNAGIMATPRWTSVDGYEMQFATNHLGHFKLTALLWERLRQQAGSRIVSVSSGGHRFGTANLADPHEPKTYSRFRQYGMTKLANLLFTYELQRRIEAAGHAPIAVACHPGGSDTELSRDLPLALRLVGPLFRLWTQSAQMGALPTLRAGTDAQVRGGEYYGPGGRGEMTGHPVQVDSSGASKDEATARGLWSLSEELSGVTFDV